MDLSEGAHDGRGSDSNRSHAQVFHWPLPFLLPNPLANQPSNPLALLADQLVKPGLRSGVKFVNWTVGGGLVPQEGMNEGKSLPNEEKAGADRVSFLGLQLPSFPTVSFEPLSTLQTARISANPLVWAASKSNPGQNENLGSKPLPKTNAPSQSPQNDTPPSTPLQKSSLPPDPKHPSKAEQSRGGAKSQPPEGGTIISPLTGGKGQPSEGGVSTASQLRGQTEAVLDSVKLAVAGISSNVMDNLPPLRKTAYPDRRKLSSVQEFYRYTEAEGEQALS